MPAALIGSARPHPDLVHAEARLMQALGEDPVRTGRPDGQHASRPQRRKGGRQPGPGIEPVVALPGEPLGAVIHVQQDGVVGPLLRLQDLGDVGLANNDPGILKGVAGKLP